MKNNKDLRRNFRISNRFQRKILTLVFFSTIIPMIVTAVGLYYLIFNLVASEMGFPEAIAYILIPVAKKASLITIIGFLFCVFFIWLWASEVSHRLAGPLERLCRELDSRISGKSKGYIYFRKKDYLAALAGRINSLLDKDK